MDPLGQEVLRVNKELQVCREVLVLLVLLEPKDYKVNRVRKEKKENKVLRVHKETMALLDQLEHRDNKGFKEEQVLKEK